MMTERQNIRVKKSSGELVAYDENKLRLSLIRSGATKETAVYVAGRISEQLVDGISTKRIYRRAFQLIKQIAKPVAARYNLKQAILALGPSGYPFEHLVSELLKTKGYNTQVAVIEKGNCLSHEIDVIAENSNKRIMVECKFHNRQGYVNDIKIPLYIQSRFSDVRKRWVQERTYPTLVHQGMVATNTRFSEDAKRYARCMELILLGWDYPSGRGLKEWIDSSGLHPITSLTTLNARQKKLLLSSNIILCRDILNIPSIADTIGLASGQYNQVIRECRDLCSPTTPFK